MRGVPANVPYGTAEQAQKGEESGRTEVLYPTTEFRFLPYEAWVKRVELGSCKPQGCYRQPQEFAERILIARIAEQFGPWATELATPVTESPATLRGARRLSAA
ncbi:hypothetical protein GCM10023336_27250 [Streptomyces similanensis]|uniref:Uncharacterized protein n=1 Tax=Streptomyces similanensis TaxID=1274988 RepID=A0ABP9KFM6_9ACTN